jgi:hypothetical protein
MLNNNELGLSLNDVSIIPAITSDIESRKECNPFDKNDMLPLFTAPMSSVVNEDNYEIFIKNKITPIIPRTVLIDKRIDLMNKGIWVALGIEEFEKYLINADIFDYPRYVVLDVANGHLMKVINYIDKAKKKHKDNVIIMGGNIANPKTYFDYARAGCDMLRLGIGGGSYCITSSNTGIYHPYVSLLIEVYKNKKYVKDRINRDNYNNSIEEFKKAPLIIIDGGIKNYSDIIKSLNLGANYVMCGGIFSKMLESAAKTEYIRSDNTILEMNQYNIKTKEAFKNGLLLRKLSYGMSTKLAQKEMGKTELKTSEGIIKYVDVEYTMEQWVDNFKDYLKSAMSYCNCRKLINFIGQQSYIVLSQNASNSFNK